MSLALAFLGVISSLAGVGVADSDIVYVGSAGCDGSDEGCQHGGNLEHVIRAIEVTTEGALKPRPDLSIDAGANPVWMATAKQGVQTCLFVARADKNDIVAFAIGQVGAASAAGPPTSSGGAAPVYAEAMDNVLLVANYHGPDNATTSDGAAASTLLILPGCELKFADTQPHSGSSINPERQGGAHVHSFVAAAAFVYQRPIAYACDLGMDAIFAYSVGADGKMGLESVTKTPPGSGPRHLVQHPKANYVYVISEMAMTVTVYKQTEVGNRAHLEASQTVSLLPTGDCGEGSKAAELAILPDGSALYATNRGRLNTVTVFSILSDGTLRQKQQLQAPAFPRGMALARGGSVLLVAGQSHTSVSSFLVGVDGRLTLERRLETGLPPHPAAFAVMTPQHGLAGPSFV
mmetsp:Transcript_46771/g.130235  ORF Transcript_46771/g.130235 Transcript_46771/m.130235 type:complete len:405 (-) Transcript_46771:129-1343(-)